MYKGNIIEKTESNTQLFLKTILQKNQKEKRVAENKDISPMFKTSQAWKERGNFQKMPL